jgi:uncharacterized protein
MNTVQEIRKFVEAECKKPTSKYGYEPFHEHFTPVVVYAEKLADELNVNDGELISIAAWLHDIGSIVSGRADHHITGAKIAETKLKELGYPPEKIELVKKCILNHRSSMQNPRESLEEKIVVEADAMTSFDNIAGLFQAAYIYEGMTREEAKDSVKRKLENKWQQLHLENSKKIIKPKYEAAMLLLGK